MKGYKAQKVDFQQAMILAVEPPHSKVGDYSLPEQFDESELDDYPLFDSNGQVRRYKSVCSETYIDCFHMKLFTVEYLNIF